MKIDVSISNVKADKDLSVLNDAKLSEESDIKLQVIDTDIKGKLELLERIDVSSLKNDIYYDISMMDKDSEEYHRLLKLLSVSGDSDDKTFVKGLKEFLREFSQGFLAEFLSGWLMSHVK